MNAFLQKNELKFRAILLFFSFYTVTTVSMDTPTVSSHLRIKPQRTITIFDPAQELLLDKPWRKVVPGSIMITPDGKGFVLGEYGQVRHSLFENKIGDVPKVIIEHPCAKKYAPMIAMAQKKDGSLLVVSAGNYTNSEKKRVAEYIVFCNGWCKTEKLDRPVQAIAIDSHGTKLAIAGQRSVVVVDVDTNQTDESFFKGLNKNENWIVDIAVYKTGRSIIGVGSQNGVQLMSLTKKDDEMDLCTLKQVESADVIKNIYYPSFAELLYLTQDGQAKTIDMYHLFDTDNDQEIKATHFAHPSSYDKVVADPSGYITTAHWTNNIKANHKIKVYRKNDKCIEKFVLEMPTITEGYDYVTKFGNRAHGIGHLLEVAVRGNVVVALATDGKMQVFDLPEESLFSKQLHNETLHEKLTELESSLSTKDTIISSNSGKNSRSPSRDGSTKFIDKHNKHVFAVTDQDELRGRKKAFSAIKVFSRSREHSPTTEKRSRGNSPLRKRDSRETSPVLNMMYNEEVDLTGDFIKISRKSENKHPQGGEEI